ncbi:DUF6323 family protein [Fusibacillus kribbianus]|uniref:DUF6323 family protein n=1 Tax=Fusibacillus kribbianus TaxID=3044208 RepID=A0AAP4BBY4_9FIRM|nr:DUF6323 family protein [Ruminococcus sp. YH-rum2234]MDI9242632.1 DUF6323 family protein [Ruminococcus sp. YH-rum2234]
MDDTFMLLLSEQSQVDLLKKTNAYAGRYGLCLTDADIQELIVRRRECLTEQQRVEFGNGILDKIIFAFCDSAYIYQDNYAETIAELQRIFYLYKNESLNEWTDDELIRIMRDAIDRECQGSLEYLEETLLDQFARNIRANTRRFMGRYEEDDEIF